MVLSSGSMSETNQNYITEIELAAACAQLGADNMAVRAFTLRVAAAAGLTQLDGLPLNKWIDKRRIEELEKMLIKVEDSAPDLAALIQQQIDAWKLPPS